MGEDGGSHQSVEDIALMRVIPGMTVLVPADANETYNALDAAVTYQGPVYLRLSRLASAVLEEQPFEIGKANILRAGKDVALFCSAWRQPSSWRAMVFPPQSSMFTPSSPWTRRPSVPTPPSAAGWSR